MNTEDVSTDGTTIREMHPIDSTVDHRALPLILGTVTGYATEPFTGVEMVMVVWPGLRTPVPYEAHEISKVGE
ncbi:hypothetical protein [Streptomyces subrutilus]|uniref:Uncharacterized protein n=1 Tax=Streptomyces subrutilus TaxID=36818 RepID=A0A1E5NXD7_9ACTN|nr:hypothetical protein [Streptomyces subrutilus]OEJ20913.1 hypothetical protein BGK67_35350 [Streptomyces subrutilus]